MRQLIARTILALRDLSDLAVALLVAGAIGLARLLPEKATTRFAVFIAVGIGMRLPLTRKVGFKNLAIAFPDMSPDEHRAILRECWANLGRTSVEYLFLDRIWDFDPETMTGSRVRFTEGSVERFLQLRDDGKPAIIVSAHLANWELPMVAAASHGLDAAALFRAPNNKYVAKWLLRRRRVAMGELISARRGSVHQLAGVVGEGRHLGLLSDQYYIGGPIHPLFGCPTRMNTTFARIARLHDCPVHAVRVIRQDDGFLLDLSEELVFDRDAKGRIDIASAMQVWASLIEKWVKEHPGQWLWLHRRWRDVDLPKS
jgi:KDO2-lipid IV(A) lauroyltransferase